MLAAMVGPVGVFVLAILVPIYILRNLNND
jgi:hypothetical protein